MPKKWTTNRDHAKRQQRPMMEDEVVAAQLEQLVTPAVLAQTISSAVSETLEPAIVS
ncbi:hypothetical protein [Chamaesiphon sp. OTE_75_metabat_556]|uniref:hypothetical protein n=1 Tax=Chamaesiphon sp. OTE_75_metabat_556 TaxID=2964692 RepID=UPI00286C9A56|nr:hypothetical protein [Chamaesiphon sp. OTE_75_metabat_556]